MTIKTVSNHTQIKTIESLAHTIWHEHYTPIIGKDQVEYMLHTFQSAMAISQQIEHGTRYFISEVQGEPIGYMGIDINHNALFLSKIYLISSKRSKGYGKKMIHFLEVLAKEHQCKTIALTVNKYNSESIMMYEKVGFRKCGTTVKKIGEGFVMDDYNMEKRVKNKF